MRELIISLVLLLGMLPAVGRAQPAHLMQREVYVVPFSHLDLYWACTEEECLSRGNRIISKAIQLAERYPEFRFVLESGVFVANFVDTHLGTQELEILKRLVTEGRIEVPPLWAGIYQNLPRGEALVRNVVYGKRYAREVFGVDSKVAHLTDIPGFTRQYPQILNSAGVPFMVMTRMGPPDLSLFRWNAPDGSSVLVWNTIKGYSWGADLGLHLELDEKRLSLVARDLAAVQATTGGPVYLGWGTDLWSPSPKVLENVSVLNQSLAPTHFRLATAEEFFKSASAKNCPNLSGEIPSAWANLDTSLLPMWLPAMSATDTLITAEKFATINYARGYAAYPNQEFETLWKDVLKSLDHNNDGQGGEIGDERKVGYAHEVSLRAGQILRDSLRNIAERVVRPFPNNLPIVVFNPLNWKRDDLVRAHVTLFGDVETDDIGDYRKAMHLLDDEGTPVPFQVEKYREGSSRSLDLMFIAQAVPSVGYKTYYLVPAEKPDAFPVASTANVQTDETAEQVHSSAGKQLLENDYYRLSIDRATGRIAILDKEVNRTVADGLEITGTEERGGDDQSTILPTGRPIVNVISTVELERNGPVETVVRIIGELADLPITQRVTLYRGLKRIDLENSVEWKPGRSISIDQVFPTQQAKAEVRIGVPFAFAASGDLMPGAGPRWDDETELSIWKRWRQIQDWVFAGTQEWGFTVSADHQLISVGDTSIQAGMLRGTRYSRVTTVEDGQSIPDLRPPGGTYVFRYAFTSGGGNWLAAKPWRAGMAFSTPLIPLNSPNEFSQKTLPAEDSFLSIDAGNVIVTALKKADRDRAIVMRAFEMSGKSADTPVRFLGENRRFRVVNLLEENRSEEEQEVLRVKAHEITTVKMKTY